MGTTYGADPLVVLPTESGSKFGTEKWQAGVGGFRSMPQSGDFWGDSSPISTPSGEAQARSGRRRHSSLLPTTTSTMDCIFEARVCWSSTPAPGSKTFRCVWASARYGTLPTARPSTSTWSPSIRCGEADLGSLRASGMAALHRGQLPVSRPLSSLEQGNAALTIDLRRVWALSPKNLFKT